MMKLIVVCVISGSPDRDKFFSSMVNDALFVAPLRASTQSSTIAHKIANMERFVIELRKPDLRENAIHELSKVLTNLSLKYFFAYF
jgi:hypothetical protein